MPIRIDEKELLRPRLMDTYYRDLLQLLAERVFYGIDFSKERDRTVMVTGRRQGKKWFMEQYMPNWDVPKKVMEPPRALTIRRVSNGFVVDSRDAYTLPGKNELAVAVAETPESLVAQVKRWAKDIAEAKP